jgi:hypothetical protein
MPIEIKLITTTVKIVKNTIYTFPQNYIYLNKHISLQYNEKSGSLMRSFSIASDYEK